MTKLALVKIHDMPAWRPKRKRKHVELVASSDMDKVNQLQKKNEQARS